MPPTIPMVRSTGTLSSAAGHAGDVIAAEVRRAIRRRSAPSALRRHLRRQGRRSLGPGRRRIWPAESIASKTSVPVYIAARTQLRAASSRACRANSRSDPATSCRQCVGAFMRTEHVRNRHHPGAGCAARSDRGGRPRGHESEQFERRVADLVRASTEQSKALTDRTRSTADLRARNARQDERSRRRGRTVGGRDARSRADRRRPHSRHRGCPFRSRSCGRRRHPRRRSGRARR